MVCADKGIFILLQFGVMLRGCSKIKLVLDLRNAFMSLRCDQLGIRWCTRIRHGTNEDSVG